MAQPRDAGPSQTGQRPTRIGRRTVLKGAAVGAGALLLNRASVTSAVGAESPSLVPLAGTGLAATGTGPSTQIAPYVLPSLPQGVDLKAILTVGDRADNGYRMVGIPDGLGAMKNRAPGEPDDDDGDDDDDEHGRRGSQRQDDSRDRRPGRTFSLFMNHELGKTVGTVRAHGSVGAFVSKWTIDRETLRVLAGEDLSRSPAQVNLWDPTTRRYVPGTTAWDRLCSADLPAKKALHHGNRGTPERIFCAGEETSFGGAWARIATGPSAGQAWELPRLGKMAFENVVASPHGKEQTIVALTDDGNINTAPVAANNPSEVFIYVGTKQAGGSDIERAGLTNGKLYGVRVFRGNTLVTEESDTLGLGDAGTGYVGSGHFELAELGTNGDVSAMDGLQMEQDAINKNVFRLQRPEDGAWDPRGSGKNDFYFVTTASISPLKNSRLWRLRFNDIDHPERGGRIEILLTNTAGRMFDNITIDRLGRLLLQEDTGNNPWVAKIWLYGIDTQTLTEIAHRDKIYAFRNFTLSRYEHIAIIGGRAAAGRPMARPRATLRRGPGPNS